MHCRRTKSEKFLQSLTEMSSGTEGEHHRSLNRCLGGFLKIIIKRITEAGAVTIKPLIFVIIIISLFCLFQPLEVTFASSTSLTTNAPRGLL